MQSKTIQTQRFEIRSLGWNRTRSLTQILLYMEKIKNPLLTTAEAAAYLGLKISYLHKLMMRHAIPYYKPMGKLCFFSQADLDHWLTCNRIASQKEIEQQAQQYLSTKRIEKK